MKTSSNNSNSSPRTKQAGTSHHQLSPPLALLAATALLLQNQQTQPQPRAQARALLEPLVSSYREGLPAAARAQFVAACALAGVRLPREVLVAEVGLFVLCMCIPPYTANEMHAQHPIHNTQPATQEQTLPSSDGPCEGSDSIAHHALAALAHEHLCSRPFDHDHDHDHALSTTNPHAGLSRALHAYPASLRLQALLAHRVGGARARDGWAAVAGVG